MGERVKMKTTTAWRPIFPGTEKEHFDDSVGGTTHGTFLDELTTALADETVMAIRIIGHHGDDRATMVTLAQKRFGGTDALVHVVGTPYAQKLEYGALAFLLTHVEPDAAIGPTDVIRAVSKRARRNGQHPVVVVQYAQLLDEQSRAVLAQMAYSRIILLVLLAVSAELLPAEFVPLCSGAGYRELIIDPLSIVEVHQSLTAEFTAVPTPVATAELAHRSEGNPGWLLALAHDAVASGKLVVRNGHLSMGRSPWPHGGRMQSLAQSQISVLSTSERRLLQVLATEHTILLASLSEKDLADVDRLIGCGFVERDGNNRAAVRHSSKLLAEVLRTDAHFEKTRHPQDSVRNEGNFYAFISGHLERQRDLSGASGPCSAALRDLLDGLRKSLLDGELERAQQTVSLLLSEHLEDLPAELFEVVVVARTVLQVTAGHFDQAQPVLDSLVVQLEVSEAAYDLWLVRSMRNFARDMDKPSQQTALPFSGRWGPARWWFSDVLATRETTRGRTQPIAIQQRQGFSQRELLEFLVGLMHGYTFFESPSAQNIDYGPSTLGTALELMVSASEHQREPRMLAGLEILINAGFVILALPRVNSALQKISANGQLTVANWVKRRHVSSYARSTSGDEKSLERSYPILDVLTKREKFVATAAAQGLKNQQIADDAGVSIRTVEGHLYQVYSKLAIGGRRDLSSLVASLQMNRSMDT
jgi:DNA-binding CsgD family transcriptional regulator